MCIKITRKPLHINDKMNFPTHQRSDFSTVKRYRIDTYKTEELNYMYTYLKQQPYK